MPSLPENATPAQVIQAYQEGMEGWIWNDEAQREYDSFWSGEPSFASASPDLVGAGDKIDRVMLWRSREKFDLGAFGQEAQTTGDCVSHGARNARDITRAVEIDIKGEPEEYYKRGATEPTYGARGHGGQGMDPAAAARFERDFGWLVRKNYEGVVDLTKYNSDIGADWGRGGVPAPVKRLCEEYKVRKVTRPSTISEVKDLLANGYSGHSGQSWGTDARTGSDGLNHKTAGWNHDMDTCGYDYSLEIWREPVQFVLNSWGPWNKPNPLWDESILGPWIPGMIVVPADDYEKYFVNSGSIHFYGNLDGFPVQHLPNYGFGYV